jgi:hypothetical protein
MRAVLGAIGLMLAAATGTGCDPFGTGWCTEIGCWDQVTVELEGPLAGSFAVTAIGDGEQPVVIDCSPTEPCGRRLVLAGFAPASLTVTYTDSAGSLVETFTPDYDRSRPNGPDCPPECRQATVLLRVD